MVVQSGQGWAEQPSVQALHASGPQPQPQPQQLQHSLPPPQPPQRLDRAKQYCNPNKTPASAPTTAIVAKPKSASASAGFRPFLPAPPPPPPPLPLKQQQQQQQQPAVKAVSTATLLGTSTPTPTSTTTSVWPATAPTLTAGRRADSSPSLARDSFVFAVPSRKAPAMVEWKNTFNVRPVLISTLRSRRHGFHRQGANGHGALGGHGGHGFPSAAGSGFGAAKSLDLLRTNLQSAINKDIKQVLNKYLERFFQPAVENIRCNLGLGSEVLVEEQVRVVLQRVLEEAKLMYATRPAAPAAPAAPAVPAVATVVTVPRRHRKRSRSRTAAPASTGSAPAAPAPDQVSALPSKPSAVTVPAAAAAPAASAVAPAITAPSVVKLANGVLGHMVGPLHPLSAEPPPATLQQMFKKRKELDAEAEARRKRARLAGLLPGGGGGTVAAVGAAATLAAPARVSSGASPSPQPRNAIAAPAAAAAAAPAAHVNYHSPKWDPSRINADTLFVMGARANKVLGYETSRGRLYAKHQDLFKYACDQEDKDWLAKNQLIQPTGGKASICILQDIHELAVSAEYKNNPNVNLLELKGFRAPEFLLRKIGAYMRNLRTEPLDDLSGLLEMDLLQEDGVATMDDSSLMELALEYGVSLMSDEASPSTSPASASATDVARPTATTPTTATGATAAAHPAPPRTATTTLSSGSMLTTLPPSLEALAPLPAAANGTATVQAVVIRAPTAPAAPTASAATAVTVAAAAASTTAVTTASSTPTSPTAPAERVLVRGLIRSQSLPTPAPFMMESLALEELEMYIKSSAVDDGHFEHIMRASGAAADPADGDGDGTLDASLDASLEANLDANLDLNLDVNLDVNGAEHSHLELAWDFIGELSTPTHSPGASPAAQGDHQDDPVGEFPAEAAAADSAKAVTAMGVALSASAEPIAIPVASTATSETSLAMSHATLTALLAGNTLDALEIPDGLL